jgi:hypothetical protein
MSEPTIELKPCPRCGSAAEISHDDGASFSPIVTDFPYHAICSDVDGCGISSFAFSTEQEAIEWWNDRDVPEGMTPLEYKWIQGAKLNYDAWVKEQKEIQRKKGKTT